MFDKKPVYSLLIPIKGDQELFDTHVKKICSQLGGDRADCYEIVGIESPQASEANKDWDRVHGDIIVVIDGDLTREPTSLLSVMGVFEKGSDMAFAGQYAPSARHSDDPELSYFGIRRASLDNIHKSPEGQQLIIEVIGPEMIKNLIKKDSSYKYAYMFGHLRKLVGM